MHACTHDKTLVVNKSKVYLLLCSSCSWCAASRCAMTGAGVSAGRVRGWPRLHSVLLAVHAGASDLYFVLISVVQLVWVLVSGRKDSILLRCGRLPAQSETSRVAVCGYSDSLCCTSMHAGCCFSPSGQPQWCLAAAQAWFFPHFVGFTVFLNGWLVLRRQHQRRATLPADIVASRTHLVTTEALQPAVIKLLLASCTGAILWLLLGLVWLLLCKAWWLVGTTWWLLCWPWVNLVWRPNLYLQVGRVFGVQQGPGTAWGESSTGGRHLCCFRTQGLYSSCCYDQARCSHPGITTVSWGTNTS